MNRKFALLLLTLLLITILGCTGEKAHISYDFDDGTKIHIGKNEMIFLPKGSSYLSQTLRKGDIGCYAINFFIDEEISFKPFSMKVKDAGKMTDLFKTAEKAFRLQKPGVSMQCKYLLTQIIYEMQNEYRITYFPSSKTSLIQNQIDYIHQNYTSERISIPLLAKNAGMSEVYFRRIFTGVTGTSPVNYINSLRISRAKELLSSKLYTVHEVATLSGFLDDSYFNRLFKKHTGISPQKYES